jgi:hypothetical protein
MERSWCFEGFILDLILIYTYYDMLQSRPVLPIGNVTRIFMTKRKPMGVFLKLSMSSLSPSILV